MTGGIGAAGELVWPAPSVGVSVMGNTAGCIAVRDKVSRWVIFGEVWVRTLEKAAGEMSEAGMA